VVEFGNGTDQGWNMALRFTAHLMLLACCIAGTALADTAPAEEVAGPAPRSREAFELQRDRVLERIRDAIGHPYAIEPAQCRLLSIGARACGQTDLRLAYSTLSIDAAELQRLATEYNRVTRVLGTGTQASDCAPPPIYRAALEDNVCVLREQAAEADAGAQAP
jgi:hypothetical protein